jgi:hypothetical protein
MFDIVIRLEYTPTRASQGTRYKYATQPTTKQWLKTQQKGNN